MDSMKAAKQGALAWNLVQELNFPDNYDPVMALAQNHIHFLNVGDDSPGTARIFVIHCKFPSRKWGMMSSCKSSFLPPTSDSELLW